MGPVGVDPLVGTDWRRAEIRDSSGCSRCGALEPVRLSLDGCSECIEYPRCRFCRRWVGDGGALTSYVRVSFEDGIALVCDICMEKADAIDVPMDMTEDDAA